MKRKGRVTGHRIEIFPSELKYKASETQPKPDPPVNHTTRPWFQTQPTPLFPKNLFVIVGAKKTPIRPSTGKTWAELKHRVRCAVKESERT